MGLRIYALTHSLFRSCAVFFLRAPAFGGTFSTWSSETSFGAFSDFFSFGSSSWAGAFGASSPFRTSRTARPKGLRFRPPGDRSRPSVPRPIVNRLRALTPVRVLWPTVLKHRPLRRPRPPKTPSHPKRPRLKNRPAPTSKSRRKRAKNASIRSATKSALKAD